MEIKRDLYLKSLLNKQNNGLIKVITGIRRCGKSYLLNTIFYNALLSQRIPEDHIVKFAFDSADNLTLIGENLIEIEKEKRKVDPEKFTHYINTLIKDSNKYYLLLDEVQMLDCFETVLNGYLRRANLDVYVTGSNAKFLSKDIITEFAGRGDEIHMYPLSFKEFMSAFSGDKYEGLTEYMMHGGIPLVVLRQDATEKDKTLFNLFDEIYIKDIVRRNNVRSKSELEELLNVLSSSIGSLTNPEKLKNTFHSTKNSKITVNTIHKYITYLEDSFLLDSAKRYDIKGKAYISTPQKYYFTDLGLRNARLNFRQFEQTHLMENLIYNELQIRGFNVDVGIVPIAERNHKKKLVRKQLEVDFICNQGAKRYYIQSAYSIEDAEKKLQEIRPFAKIEDSFKKIIITRDFVPTTYDENGILVLNIYDFLLNDNCLEI